MEDDVWWLSVEAMVVDKLMVEEEERKKNEWCKVKVMIG